MRDEEFDNELERLVNEEPAGNLLTVPGIYEILSEHFNNEVLQRLKEKRDKEREEVEDDG